MPEGSRGHFTRDPFAITPDPDVYVPREATEVARKELLRSASNPAKTTALLGPPGLGKTLLLHLLAEEVPEDTQTVYLPYAALPPVELCAWALELLDSQATDDPIAALASLLRDLRERGSSLLMLIDDAGSMPIATARWVGELAQRSSGGLQLVVAASDSVTGNRVIAAIGSNFDIVHLNDPMTVNETRKYIDGRLALARVPGSVRARFDDRIVLDLHRVSAGIPRRLHSAASGILQEAPAVSEGDRGIAPTALVDAPDESAAAAQTLGVPSDERRVARRRAEVEGVPVRVGLGDEVADTGRRAEDRVEAATDASESAVAESVEPAAEESLEPAAEESLEPAAEELAAPESIESESADGDAARDREYPAAPAAARRAPSPSHRTLALGALLVFFVAVTIPVIRSLLSDPRRIAVVEPSEVRLEPMPADSGESTQPGFGGRMAADSREPVGAVTEEAIQADSGESMRAILGESGDAIEPAGPKAREASDEIRSEASADEPPNVERPGAVPPIVNDVGPLAVQINATPWANIEVDGIDLGATPLANVPLLAGEHSFRAKMPDGRVIERTVEIDAERRFISFE